VPAAKGMLSLSELWCENHPEVPRRKEPSDKFILWYDQKKGLVMEVGDNHYQYYFNKPQINPFIKNLSNTSSSCF